MSCGYCRNQFDQDINLLMSTPCKHNICRSCVLYLKKHNQGKCPQHNEVIELKNPDRKLMCLIHERKFLNLCEEHLTFICNKCTGHENCKKISAAARQNELLDTILNNYKSKPNINTLSVTPLETINNFIDIAEKEIEEYKYLLSELTLAKSSNDVPMKQKINTHHQNLSTLMNKAKTDTGVFEKMLVKPSAPIKPSAQAKPVENPKPYVPNARVQESGDRGEFPQGDAEQGGDQEQYKPDAEVAEIYNTLNQKGKKHMRMFYKTKILEQAYFSSIFYVVQDLEDMVTITGFGVGRSSVGEFINVIHFEMIVDDVKISLDDEIIINSDESIVQEVSLPVPISLPRNASGYVMIEVQGENIYCFTHPEMSKVSVVDADGQAHFSGCPILYFLYS